MPCPEMWLESVVKSMQTALRDECRQALARYHERPRTKWIFDHSAQATIVASRTVFTAEVNTAFDQMEEGQSEALQVC